MACNRKGQKLKRKGVLILGIKKRPQWLEKEMVKAQTEKCQSLETQVSTDG